MESNSVCQAIDDGRNVGGIRGCDDLNAPSTKRADDADRYGRHFDRLLVRHLPPELKAQDKEDLLKEFGATDVKMCLNNKQFRYG